MEAVEWDEAQEETDKGVTQISWSLSQVLLYLRIFDLMVSQYYICIGYLACKDFHPQAVLRIFSN